MGLIGFDVGTGGWIVRPELPQTPKTGATKEPPTASSLSQPPDSGDSRDTVTSNGARGLLTAARQQKRRVTA